MEDEDSYSAAEKLYNAVVVHGWSCRALAKSLKLHASTIFRRVVEPIKEFAVDFSHSPFITHPLYSLIFFFV